jgi:hypothetical protein
MGRLSSLKGKQFERKIANVLRAQWPGIEVRRSSQADRAVNSDVYITNAPIKLERIWWECEDSRTPNPAKKLEQAERDIASLPGPQRDRLPVVVWHRIGERHSSATMPLAVLDILRGKESVLRNEPVTMELGAFLDVLSGGVK